MCAHRLANYVRLHPQPQPELYAALCKYLRGQKTSASLLVADRRPENYDEPLCRGIFGLYVQRAAGLCAESTSMSRRRVCVRVCTRGCINFR